MNKITISIISILSILLCIFFFMWRNTSNNNKSLTNSLNQANIELVNLKSYNEQKDKEISNIQKAYNKVVSEYKGTECENMKVSVEMIEALKQIRNANDN